MLVDGDKTIINEDSFRICTNNHVTKVFDGDFYTGYQSYKFNKEVSSLKFDYSLMKNITLNYSVYNKIKDSNYVVLSSGISEIWEKLCHVFGIKNHIADSLISADTKFFITKLLKSDGYKVKSFGDSMVDLYMLRNSDEGYLFLGNKMSHSLVNVNTSGLNLMYNKEHVILLNSNESFVKERVDICKSDSGISGNILAKAHYELGEYAGEYMKKILPNKDTGILILERGGRFFGDGFYINYGGTLYPYNPKKDELPKFKENNIIILDSVINSGKSLIELIESIKSFKSSINIFIVANVIQEKSLALFKDYKLVAIRSSSNSFVGATQVKQIAGKGPDTADRLFNLIK